METKEQIRTRILNKRNQLTGMEKQNMSNLITNSFLKSALYQNAETILLFADFRNEVETKQLFLQGLLDQKKLFFPKVLGGTMDFFQIKDYSELKPDYMGILEPDHNNTPFFKFEKQKSSKTCIIMPGAVFDIYGNRIGYGKGYYDRYLLKNPIPNKIGFAFDFQVLTKIPCESFDVKTDYIFSNIKTYKQTIE